MAKDLDTEPSARLPARQMIYIVEDEPELREILTEALAHVGYDTRSASNGQSLLDLVHGEVPDLILMDIGLPDMTGWELQRQLQADMHGRHPDIPVIAVTGYGGGQVQRNALETLRFADYIQKPYSLAELVNRVERALEDHADSTTPAAPDPA